MKDSGLLHKVVLGLLTAAILGSLSILVLFYEASDRFEIASLNQVTSTELDLLSAMLEEKKLVELPIAGNNLFFQPSNPNSPTLPPEFAGLRPGLHHDIIIDTKHYHVAVRDTPQGRIVLAIDISPVEKLEEITTILFIAGITAIMLLSVITAAYIARRAINPVSRLARQVHDLDPTKRNIRIAEEYSGYEVGLIANAFDRYCKRLDDYVVREQSFAATASHELRTPLAVITTSLDVLLSGPELPKTSHSAVQRIYRASEQMSDLISTLLFLAREPDNTQATAEEIKGTDFSHLLHSIVNDHTILLKSSPIRLHTHIHETVILPASEVHLRIIINNLLRNAITHTQKGSITINLDEKQLTISDTGSGIKPEIMALIFRRDFSGSQHSSLNFGFGLYLCKQLCDRYGWGIEVDSQLNHGTQIQITFTPTSRAT
jgi:signal transduction histidine kinase